MSDDPYLVVSAIGTVLYLRSALAIDPYLVYMLYAQSMSQARTGLVSHRTTSRRSCQRHGAVTDQSHARFTDMDGAS